MLQPTTALEYGLGLLAIGATGYVVVATWRRRQEPTARPLLAFAIVLALGAVTSLATSTPPVERAIDAFLGVDTVAPYPVLVLSLAVLVGGGLWFLFVLEYTGRGGRLVPASATALVGYWLFLVVAAAVSDLSVPPEAEADPTSAEIVLFVGLFPVTILVAVGCLLVVTTALRRTAVRTREALVLTGGAAALSVGQILVNLAARRAVVPLVFLSTAVLFLVAIRRYPTVEVPPAVRIAGRDRLIEELADAVVVVDREERIRDLNPAAERCFDVDRDDVLGTPLDSLFQSAIDPAEIAATGEPAGHRTDAGTVLAITGNDVTDARDRSFGHLLVCRDVTDRQRRERRLGVLTQLLTGAVSERMTTVADRAAALANGDRAAAPDAVGADVREQTSELVDLVARARDVERALAESGTDWTDVPIVVRSVVDDVEDGTDLDVTVESDPVRAAIDAAVLETILETVLADARDRARTRLDLEVVEDGPAVRIVDDGPTDGGDRSAAADARRRDDGDDESRSDRNGTQPDADDARSRSELTVEMAGLAARHVGGDVVVEHTGAGERRTVIELPDSDDEGVADVEPAVDGTVGLRSETTADRSRSEATIDPSLSGDDRE